jgi:predicted deacetylase
MAGKGQDSSRKKTIAVADGTILLSLHNVNPTMEDDVIKSYDLLTDLGIASFTLLVTPLYELKRSNSFEKHDLFAEYLQSLNLEISLHGYSHTVKSGAHDEFRRIPQERAISRLKSGVSLIKKSFGQKPFGFVPPLWMAPRRIVNAVRDVGFNYCVVDNSLHHLPESRVFETAECLVSHGMKDVSFIKAQMEIELGGPLQIGIHPLDYKVNSVFKILEDMKDRLGYRFVGYRDYLLTHD